MPSPFAGCIVEVTPLAQYANQRNVLRQLSIQHTKDLLNLLIQETNNVPWNELEYIQQQPYYSFFSRSSTSTSEWLGSGGVSSGSTTPLSSTTESPAMIVVSAISVVPCSWISSSS